MEAHGYTIIEPKSYLRSCGIQAMFDLPPGSPKPLLTLLLVR
jgi:hypothetical protein